MKSLRVKLAGHLFAMAFVILPEGKVKQMLRELVREMQSEIDNARRTL